MKVSDRVFRLTAQVALLLTLLALSAFLLLRTYLGDEEQVWNDGAVTEVVERGPVTIDKVTWQVESMQPYARLADEQRKEIPVDGLTAGAVVVLVKVKLTPLDGLRMGGGGFTCEASLRDDRGNVWKSVEVFRLPLTTYCSNDDKPLKRNQANEVAKVFVVPASAVEHLNGIQVETRQDFRRVLITF
ncbi:hypothetical protein Kfla_0007 [Kribbella flavida DSM 17836]|uniref:Uncharacterized protein n=1 Tax=Kribbella flavida (strain DSM 17836 / JCM 10339 / NBRC 14399) TaxID=479435 RepID=D2PQF1_KRIFD|nr:hypothetical protein [Kribbella flavida]ADB29138.1 hypothetical protein Kfla_0007 [Kribbella flavida DSM 17836]